MTRLEPLLHLAHQLGIHVDDLRRAEGVDRLAGTFQISSRGIARLDDQTIQNLLSEYGAAIEMTISTGDLEEFTLRDATFDSQSLSALVDEAGRVEANYHVSLRIDKPRLIENVIGTPGDAAVRLFFFGAVLAEVLSQPPADIERRLWRDPTRRLVVVILDTDLRLTGDCLSVVGGDGQTNFQDEARRPIPPDLNRVAVRRNDYVGWDNALATSLTPQHFQIDDEQAAGQLADRVTLLAVGLGAMYLSDRCREVQRPDGSAYTVAEFRGREHVAFVPIDWTSAPPATVDARQADAVLAVVAWSYERRPEYPSSDMIADRLPFVQTRLAQLLEGRPEADRLPALASVMPDVNEGVKWQWRSFIEGRVVEYLEQVRELEAAVTEIVGVLTDRTSVLVKRLSETSLAAIAAFIGSFIAAAFKDPFQAELFRVGMLTYAVYVVIFPFALGVASTSGDVRVALSTFKAQRKNLANVVGDDRVDELVASRPQEAQDRFTFWRNAVSILYLLAVAAAIAAAIAVPNLIGSEGEGDTTGAPAATAGSL